MRHWQYGLLAGILLNPCIARATVAPRSVVSIDRSSVTLGDLFSGLGSEAGRIIGPAPAPGRRIDVQARQLGAIARQFGVPWHLSEEAGSPEVVILRQGRAMPRKIVTAALQAPLAAAGAPVHAAISITPAELPMIPPHAAAHVVPLNVSYDAGSGQFTAALLISAPTMRSTQVRISGYAQPSRLAVVAAHALTPGEVITRKDVALRRMPVHALSPNAPSGIADVIGLEAKRAVAEGAALNTKDLTHPRLVARGSTVRLDLTVPGLTVSAQGIALGSGTAGAVVPVLNPASHLVVQAIVDGPDHAHVVPGSRPTRQSVGGESSGDSYYTRFSERRGGLQ